MRIFQSLALALVALSLAFAAAPGAWAQTQVFSRQPPAWQGILAASTDTDAGRAIAASGKGAAIACSGCHGATGVPAQGTPFPRLAGLSAEYLAKQLVDDRAGARSNPMMEPVAKALSDADIGSLARYYGSLKTPSGKAADATPSARAEQLQKAGDNALALPACANCHGHGGTGAGPLLPALAGQPADYTSSQLNAFRAGERKNDPDTVMRALASRLSDSDIRALSDYFAAMP
jgi:cytochrome c553